MRVFLAALGIFCLCAGILFLLSDVILVYFFQTDLLLLLGFQSYPSNQAEQVIKFVVGASVFIFGSAILQLSTLFSRKTKVLQ